MGRCLSGSRVMATGSSAEEQIGSPSQTRHALPITVAAIRMRERFSLGLGCMAPNARGTSIGSLAPA